MVISPREARKFSFAFIFQLSGWALVSPSCFALQVPDVRGLQVPVGTRLRTALVSLERSHFRNYTFALLQGQNRYGHGGPAVVAPMAL